jgi:hypothetical protein
MTQPIPHDPEAVLDDGRPFCELRDTGLLWLINRTVFHPRGFALALMYDEPGQAEGGNVTGWQLYGDGTEPWSMGDPPQHLRAQGHKTEDQLFALVQALLAPGPRPDPIKPEPPNDAIPMRLIT